MTIITQIGDPSIIVEPSDVSMDKQFVFAIQAVAEGGAKGITDYMTLNVGCGFWNIVSYPTDVQFNTT